MSSIYDFSVTTPKGEEVSLKDYEGKVILIVNTATGCGFTPQYKDLEEIYEEFHDRGFEIIDIPCNQFAGQTPGTDDEIHEFCTLKYNTRFPQMKKSDVNGENQLPLYKYLKSQQGFKGLGEGKMADLLRGVLPGIDPNYEHNSDIKWNFTKFVIDREGRVAARFEPTCAMSEVEKFVVSLL